MAKLTPIKPKKKLFDATKLKRELRKAKVEAGEGIQRDYKKTVATWTTKPDFPVTIADTFIRVAPRGEGAKVFGYVDLGTKPHVIRPKARTLLKFNPIHRAKTVPGQLTSRTGGSTGGPAFAKVVHHPGTEPRDFSEFIQHDWERKFKRLIDEAIERVLR